jgi:hypothetical protein
MSLSHYYAPLRGDRLQTVAEGGKEMTDNLTKRNRRVSHGASNSRLYKVYQGIMTRCYNPNARQYKHYGGKGVKVCLEWKYNPKAFFAWALANGYDPNAARNECTIDRINPDGDYEPSNCRWVNQKEQCNNKTNNRNVVFNGKEMSVSQFAEMIGIDYFTAYNRIIRQGLSAEETAIGCDYKP